MPLFTATIVYKIQWTSHFVHQKGQHVSAGTAATTSNKQCCTVFNFFNMPDNSLSGYSERYLAGEHVSKKGMHTGEKMTPINVYY
jgi:hypothetical protein